jgi:hypothetical protein
MIEYHMTTDEFRIVIPAADAHQADPQRVAEMLELWLQSKPKDTMIPTNNPGTGASPYPTILDLAKRVTALEACEEARRSPDIARQILSLLTPVQVRELFAAHCLPAFTEPMNDLAKRVEVLERAHKPVDAGPAYDGIAVRKMLDDERAAFQSAVCGTTPPADDAAVHGLMQLFAGWDAGGNRRQLFRSEAESIAAAIRQGKVPGLHFMPHLEQHLQRQCNDIAAKDAALAKRHLQAKEMHGQIAALRAQLAEATASLDLQRKSNERARARYDAAHPEDAGKWPDRTDMVLWLMGECDSIGVELRMEKVACEEKQRELDAAMKAKEEAEKRADEMEGKAGEWIAKHIHDDLKQRLREANADAERAKAERNRLEKEYVEIHRLKKALVDCATAVGASTTTQNSLDFLTYVPGEVLAVLNHERKISEATRQDVQKANRKIEDMHAEVAALKGRRVTLPPLRHIKSRAVSDYTFSEHAEGWDDAVHEMAQWLDLVGIPYDELQSCTVETLRAAGVEVTP